MVVEEGRNKLVFHIQVTNIERRILVRGKISKLYHYELYILLFNLEKKINLEDYINI